MLNSEEFVKLKDDISSLNSVRRPIDSKVSEEFNKFLKDSVIGYSEHVENSHAFLDKKEASATLLKRLKNEFTMMSEYLPCNVDSCFFIKSHPEFPQNMKFLVAGSRGSPYEHGLFEFDLFLPDTYPSVPPKCNIKTIGKGNIRFNPNLYSNGYVCLSLLGTWGASWDPKLSNIYQLLISLTGLVMNDNIGENEPGNEQITKNSFGYLENEAYANIVRLGNLQYAMIDMITNPPKGFEKEVESYFKYKGEEILKDLKLWLERSKFEVYYSGIAQQNSNWCTKLNEKGAYEKELKTKISEFAELIEKLKSV